ncbi:MAG TPA: ABC transporter permease [Syntrophomonadaceae bacterium]|nr:ABC transporter permease [Syntrophomonadaceae bacterium]
METVLKRISSEWPRITIFHPIWKRGFLPVLLLMLWHWITASGYVKPVLFPSPESVLQAFIEMLGSGELLGHLSVSLIRVMEGFAIASFMGVGMGMAMGLFPLLNDMIEGILQMIRPIPPIAWLPLAILWFGIEEGSKIFIIALGAFFPIFLNVLNGIRQTDTKLVEIAQVLEVAKLKFTLKVVIPGSMPFIMTGLRVGLGYAWMCVVAAELSGGMRGMGYMLTDARSLAQTDKVVVGMMVIGLVGKAMDGILRLVEGRIVGWRELYTGE